MSGDPVLAPVHVLPLVHPVGPASRRGFGVEGGGGGSVHACAFLVVPKMTHVSNASISSRFGAAAGGGGIGLVVLFIRTSASCAMLFVGSTFDMAVRSA